MHFILAVILVALLFSSALENPKIVGLGLSVIGFLMAAGFAVLAIMLVYSMLTGNIGVDRDAEKAASDAYFKALSAHLVDYHE